MVGRHVVFRTGIMAAADVGTPQVVNLVGLRCPSLMCSGNVATGRPVSALFKKLASGFADPASPQKGWSRGCRRADASFWFLQWLPPWLLVPRKKKPSWSNRSRSSPSTPASTSDLPGRACQPRLTRLAPRPCVRGVIAAAHPLILTIHTVAHCPLWAVVLRLAIGAFCQPDRRIPGC